MKTKYQQALKEAVEAMKRDPKAIAITIEALEELCDKAITQTHDRRISKDGDFVNPERYTAVFPFEYKGFSLLTLAFSLCGECGPEFEVYVYCFDCPMRWVGWKPFSKDGKPTESYGFANFKTDYCSWTYSVGEDLLGSLADISYHKDGMFHVRGAEEFFECLKKTFGEGVLIPDKTLYLD